MVLSLSPLVSRGALVALQRLPAESASVECKKKKKWKKKKKKKGGGDRTRVGMQILCPPERPKLFPQRSEHTHGTKKNTPCSQEALAFILVHGFLRQRGFVC